ncbi:MAG: hypothetical protein ACOCVC_04960 [Spirochaeta sp.]
MKRSLLLLSVGYLLLPMAIIIAQENASNPQDDLMGDVGYEFHIFARLIEDSGEQAWDSEIVRQTISGRTISIRLEGESIVVLAEFTPYEHEDNAVMLVAQGQTWISEADTEGVRYRTAFKSLPLALGESLYFFPLGVNYAETSSDGMNLELEIQLYRMLADSPVESPAEPPVQQNPETE